MPGPISSLTGGDNYFEDFVVGAKYEHARGKTVTEMDGVLITNMVMNTAQGHFNEDQMAKGPMGQRIVFGGVTAAMVVGLAMQDTGEQALAEIGMTGIRFRVPVHHGDTLYAFSEVLETRDSDRPDAGVVRFAHRGLNQDGKVVFEGERTVLLKRRSHWGDR
ncbi:MAG TPA: MaoC family dehydratase [Tepidiformaceae bacterium]|nr:MaoC family dehydratase [Dehalococcoidia bacterium]HNM79394.1 MaoC family dehydratase [Tepidiformaceae bacterium]